MFQPTHLLVSRSRQTPVQLVAGSQGYELYTEKEWQQSRKPAFEMRSKLGIFCQGIPVVGYNLQPLTANMLAEENPALAQGA
ncbi:MAG: hypothetical protein ICV77_08565 [Cyanobacteria bacterium Co-bin8]|nr:hypothetical protein [Cyanobacteria bacterium Co-bin8]